MGLWPRQQVAVVAQPAFRRGDALVNVTQLSKTFDTGGGLASWRLSVATGWPRLHQTAEAGPGRK